MATQLIPYAPRQLNGATVQTVDGRDIHAFLGISRDYNAWMRQQIKRAHLVEGRDFTTYLEVGNPNGGRPASQSYLTFDAAKHVGMLSNTAKGHEVREYFIACEKELLSSQDTRSALDASPDLKIIVEVVTALAESRQRIASLEAEQHAQREALIATQAQTIANLQQINLLLDGQAWLTIHQYLVISQLHGKLTPAEEQAYGRHLTTYCLAHGLHTYPAPVSSQRWNTEQTYYVGALRDTLPGWLARRYAQPALVVLPQTGQP